mgnify:CR=1
LGILFEKGRGKFIYKKKEKLTYTGILCMLTSGKGKVYLSEKNEEYLIPTGKLNRALDGDLINFNIIKNSKKI